MFATCSSLRYLRQLLLYTPRFSFKTKNKCGMKSDSKLSPTRGFKTPGAPDRCPRSEVTTWFVFGDVVEAAAENVI